MPTCVWKDHEDICYNTFVVSALACVYPLGHLLPEGLSDWLTDVSGLLEKEYEKFCITISASRVDTFLAYCYSKGFEM